MTTIKFLNSADMEIVEHSSIDSSLVDYRLDKLQEEANEVARLCRCCVKAWEVDDDGKTPLRAIGIEAKYLGTA